MKTYYELSEELDRKAPSQARLLRYLLMQREMQDAETIKQDLGIKDSLFRHLVDRLRDRSVEVVCVRTHAPEGRNVDVRYLYGIDPASVEGYVGGRRTDLLTAWNRASGMFERHLLALEIPVIEVGKILGAMETVGKVLRGIDLDVSAKTEAAARQGGLPLAPEEAIFTAGE